MRNTSNAVYKNTGNIINYIIIYLESESMLLSCDFFSDGNYVITTTLEGDVNVHSVKDELGILSHNTLTSSNLKSNIAYCSHYVKEI